jgi:hypothetical protein
MECSQQAIEAAREAGRRADAAAEEMVRRVHEAAAGDDTGAEGHR